MSKLDKALAQMDAIGKRELKLSGESGLRNLKSIYEMAQEERGLHGNREANAVWIRNKFDIQRWVKQVIDAGMTVPDYVNGNRSLWS